MAYIPFTPEIGAKYTLTGPNGVVATFNDPTDADYSGWLSDVSGLDSPDVRESGDVTTEADGGWQGLNFYGRRPITISGTVAPITDATDRANKLDRIRQSCDAMRADAVLSWVNSSAGSVPMQTWVRRQQPLRISGGWAKTFQIQIVSRYAPLFSATQHSTASSGGSAVVENKGNYPAFPVIVVNGPTSGTITITNTTQSLVFAALSGMTLSGGQSVSIDMLNHTATRNDGTSYNQYIDFLNSTWPAVYKGNNTFTLTGAPSMSILWRDEWV